MIHLLSGWSEEYAALAKITWPGKEAYAKARGYKAGFYIHGKARRHDGTGSSNIAWDRPAQWLRYMETMADGDWVWISGCDLAISNPAIDVARYCDDHFDLIASNDCNCLNCDSMLVKNNYRTRMLMKRVAAEQHTGRFMEEQQAINTILSGKQYYQEFYASVGHRFKTSELQSRLQDALNGSDIKVKLVTQKYFNTYDAKHLPNEGSRRLGPIHIPTDGSNWEPGDFTIHMVNRSLEYRIKHLPEYLK